MDDYMVDLLSDEVRELEEQVERLKMERDVYRGVLEKIRNREHAKDCVCYCGDNGYSCGVAWADGVLGEI